MSPDLEREAEAARTVIRAAVPTVPEHVLEKRVRHYKASLRHAIAIGTGVARQPRYFTQARPGMEETRGIPFAPKEKGKPKGKRR